MEQPSFGMMMAAILVPAMLVASWNDYRMHRVSNRLNALIVLTGLSAQAFFGGWAGLEAGLLGVLVGFGMLIVLWAVRGMGAGDVKFMAAVGAWLGPLWTFQAVLVGGVLGGVIALGMIAYRRSWHQATANVSVLMTKVSSVRTAFSDFGSAEALGKTCGVMPYAIPLTIGALAVLGSNFSKWWGVL